MNGSIFGEVLSILNLLQMLKKYLFFGKLEK